MQQNIEACEWLTTALRGLEVPNIDPIYAKMRGVCSLPFNNIKASFNSLGKGSSRYCLHVVLLMLN